MANDDAIADLEAKLRQIQEEERLLARREDLTKEREQVRREIELERRYEDYKGIQKDARKEAELEGRYDDYKSAQKDARKKLVLQRNQQASQARKPVTVTTGEAEIIPPPEVSVGQAEDIQTISPRGQAAMRLNQAAAGRRGILEGGTTFRGSKETQEAPTEVVGEWAPADPETVTPNTDAAVQDALNNIETPNSDQAVRDALYPNPVTTLGVSEGQVAPAEPPVQQPTPVAPGGDSGGLSLDEAKATNELLGERQPGGLKQLEDTGALVESEEGLGVPEGTEQYAQDASYAVDVNVAALVDAGLDPKMAAEIAGNEDLTRIALDAARDYDEKLLFQRQLNDIDSDYADEKVAIAARRAKMGKQFLQEKKADLARLQEMKVDPNRFLQAGGMGRKLAMLAGVVLSGLAGGNQNMALQFIERMVDRDIDAQKANINQANRAFQLRDSYYQTALAQLGDEELAALETHRRAKVMLQDKLLEQLQTAPHHKQAAVEASLQAVQQSLAESAQRAQDRQLELAEKLGKIAETGARTRKLQIEAGVESKKLRGGTGQKVQEWNPVTMINLEGTGITVDGKPFLDFGEKGKELRKDVAGTINSEVEAIQILDRIISSGEIGRDRLGATQRELLKQDIATLLESKILSEGRGLSNEDLQMIERALGESDPNKFFGLVRKGGILQKYKRRRNYLLARVERRITDVSKPGAKVKVDPPKFFSPTAPKPQRRGAGTVEAKERVDRARSGASTAQDLLNEVATLETIAQADPLDVAAAIGDEKATAAFPDRMYQRALELGANSRQAEDVKAYATGVVRNLRAKAREEEKAEQQAQELNDPTYRARTQGPGSPY